MGTARELCAARGNVTCDAAELIVKVFFGMLGIELVERVKSPCRRLPASFIAQYRRYLVRRAVYPRFLPPSALLD